jgi:hypothetical protein
MKKLFLSALFVQSVWWGWHNMSDGKRVQEIFYYLSLSDPAPFRTHRYIPISVTMVLPANRKKRMAWWS